MIPVVKIGNSYYFLYLLFGALFTLAIIKFLGYQKPRQRTLILFGLMMIGVILHVIKAFFPPYNALEYPFRKLTLESICAVSTVFFPIIFLTKSKTLKDYMVMTGIASGLLAFLYPANALIDSFDGIHIGLQPAFSFEIIRFYVHHWLLWIVPFSMMFFKMHTLSFKRVLRAPLILFSVFLIIYLNELVLTQIGWAPKEDLYNPEGRNPSWIFGIPSTFRNVGGFLLILVPPWMLSHPLSGEAFSWPVLWMAIPIFVYASLLALVFVSIYDPVNTKAFFKKWLHMGKTVVL